MEDEKSFKKLTARESGVDDNESYREEDNVENIEVNLQDDYFISKPNKNEEDNSLKLESKKIKNSFNYKRDDNHKLLIETKSSKINSEQILKENAKSKIQTLKEGNISVSKVSHNKRSSIDERKKKPSINIFVNNSNAYNNNQKSQSPRQNKFKENDKIIETNLNEIYIQKAKALGDKMKKKLNQKVIRNSVHGNQKPLIIENDNNLRNNLNFKNNNPTINHNIVAKLNLKDINKELLINKQNEYLNFQNVNLKNLANHNKSLSISAVTFNNEQCFNSELDIMENFINFDSNKQENKILKKDDLNENIIDLKKQDFAKTQNISSKFSNLSKSPLQQNRNNKNYVNNYLNSGIQTNSTSNIKNFENNKNSNQIISERSKDNNKRNSIVSHFSFNNSNQVNEKIEINHTNNVDKFLNNINVNLNHVPIKKKETSDSNEAKVTKLRDYSPSLNQARLEKNLNKQCSQVKVKVNEIPVSKNAIEFIKEYSNFKNNNLTVKTDFSVERNQSKDRIQRVERFSRSNSKYNIVSDQKKVELKKSLDDLDDYDINEYNDKIFTVKKLENKKQLSSTNDNH